MAILRKKIAYIDDEEFKKAEIKNIDKILSKDYKLYSKNKKELLSILTPKFINFIKNTPQKLSFLFEDANIYVLLETKKDNFKLGSLYKNTNDKTQYYKFKNDVMNILNIIEKIADFPQFNCKININK